MIGHKPQHGTVEALSMLSTTPLGRAAAIATLIGLCLFALFRIIEAVTDVHGYGDDLAGLLRRVALAGAGIIYAVYVAMVGSVIFGWRAAESSDQAARDWVAWLLSLPAGPWIVGAIGVAIVCSGIGLAVSGVAESYRRRVRVEEDVRRYVKVLGDIGFIARSIVMLLVGTFLIYAAVTVDPSHAKSSGNVLQTIVNEPYGAWLLGLLAAGLVAFGIFGLAEATFAQIKEGR